LGRLGRVEVRDAEGFQHLGGMLAASGHAQLPLCAQIHLDAKLNMR
jgi:hypothetical protein